MLGFGRRGGDRTAKADRIVQREQVPRGSSRLGADRAQQLESMPCRFTAWAGEEVFLFRAPIGGDAPKADPATAAAQLPASTQSWRSRRQFMSMYPINKSLGSLYDRVSAGIHADVDVGEARALVLQTYLFLGELLSLPQPSPNEATL